MVFFCVSEYGLGTSLLPPHRLGEMGMLTSGVGDSNRSSRHRLSEQGLADLWGCTGRVYYHCVVFCVFLHAPVLVSEATVSASSLIERSWR